jgi:hypothetical protein
VELEDIHESVKVSNEEALKHLKVSPQHSSGEAEEINVTSVRIANNSAQIRNESFPNTNLERISYT